MPWHRLVFSWTTEVLRILGIILLLPLGLIYRRSSRAGRRETIVIGCDLFTNPLVYHRLQRYFSKNGFSVYIFKSAFAWNGLREHARKLAEQLERRNITKAIYVGHGMAGLIPLALPDSARRRLEHLVTLGAPFHGSRLFLPFAFMPAMRDMCPGSEFLLIFRMNALLFPSFSPFCAWRDEMIYPSNLAHFGQGRDMVSDIAGHLNIAMNGENMQMVGQFLADKYPEPLPEPPVPEAVIAPAKAKVAAKKKPAHVQRKAVIRPNLAASKPKSKAGSKPKPKSAKKKGKR